MPAHFPGVSSATLLACGLGVAGEHVAQILMRIDASSPANCVENGRLVPTLQAYDVARKICFVEVDFSGTLIQPSTGTSFRREAPFRTSLKPRSQHRCMEPLQRSVLLRLQVGGANLLKSDKIFLSGKNP
jgi:hypothetical protein